VKFTDPSKISTVLTVPLHSFEYSASSFLKTSSNFLFTCYMKKYKNKPLSTYKLVHLETSNAVGMYRIPILPIQTEPETKYGTISYHITSSGFAMAPPSVAQRRRTK